MVHGCANKHALLANKQAFVQAQHGQREDALQNRRKNLSIDINIVNGSSVPPKQEENDAARMGFQRLNQSVNSANGALAAGMLNTPLSHLLQEENLIAAAQQSAFGTYLPQTSASSQGSIIFSKELHCLGSIMGSIPTPVSNAGLLSCVANGDNSAKALHRAGSFSSFKSYGSLRDLFSAPSSPWVSSDAHKMFMSGAALCVSYVHSFRERLFAHSPSIGSKQFLLLLYPPSTARSTLSRVGCLSLQTTTKYTGSKIVRVLEPYLPTAHGLEHHAYTHANLAMARRPPPKTDNDEFFVLLSET
jgi:hypothetical protein